MAEELIVGLIVAVAVAYIVYRYAFKKSNGCGCGESKTKNGCCGGKETPSSCGCKQER